MLRTLAIAATFGADPLDSSASVHERKCSASGHMLLQMASQVLQIDIDAEFADDVIDRVGMTKEGWRFQAGEVMLAGT